MMVSSWRRFRRVMVTLAALWVTTAASATPSSPGGGGSPSEGTSPPSLIHKLEQSLLTMFGMQHRPRPKRSALPPPYMMELYHRQADLLSEEAARREMEEEEDQVEYEEEEELDVLPSGSPNTVRSFVHKENPADHLYPASRMRFHFNVSSVPTEETLYSADLRLTHTIHPSVPAFPKNVTSGKSKGHLHGKHHRRKKWTSDDVPYLHRIMVYDIVRLATKKTEPGLKLLDTKVIDARREGALSFDVFDALGRWILEPKKNYGLLVDVVPLNKASPIDTSHVHLRRPEDSPADSSLWHHRQPLLVLHTNDPKALSRRRRSSPTKHKKTKNYCKRYPLFVDFRKVGWDDWIVAPAGYEAFFCKGDCPFPLSEEMNATNHAVVQTLVNSRYPDRVPKACCVPTELSAISMLYMDVDEGFVLKNHQDMVVEGCGCR